MNIHTKLQPTITMQTSFIGIIIKQPWQKKNDILVRIRNK